MAENKKKQKKIETTVLKKSAAVSAAQAAAHIIRPHITEKAARLAESFIYTFEVTPRSNKTEIAKAIKALYGVTPIKVNMVHEKPQHTFVRGQRGMSKGSKKAYVYLKKGQVIEFV